MVRLMFFMPQFPGFGGIETVSANLIEYLGKDMEIYVFALKRAEGMEVPECLKGVFIPKSGKRAAITEYYNEVVNACGITHVISQGGFSHLTRIVLNKKRNKDVKVITAFHGMPGYELIEFEGLKKVSDARNKKKLKWKLYWFLGLGEAVLEFKRRKYHRIFADSFKRACSKGDRIVLLSDGYVDSFVSLYKLEKWREKVVAIPNPCPLKYADVVPLPGDLRADEVLYVGRLSHDKGLSFLIDVWSRIKDRGGWKFRIVGDGPAREALEAKVRDSGIGDVVFDGYAVEPGRFYKRAKILLLASDFEGFGMCLLEGARFGVVPVAIDISAGVRDVVSEGAGVLVEKRDADKMASAVQTLMDDGSYWEEMSRNAFAHSKKFSIGPIGGQWRNLIMSL